VSDTHNLFGEFDNATAFFNASIIPSLLAHQIQICVSLVMSQYIQPVTFFFHISPLCRVAHDTALNLHIRLSLGHQTALPVIEYILTVLFVLLVNKGVCKLAV
jgi:hypothetical protein